MPTATTDAATSPTPAAAPEQKTWRQIAREELETEKERLGKALEKENERMKRELSENRSFYPPAPGYYWCSVALYLLLQVAFGGYVSLPLTSIAISIGMPVNVGMFFLLLQAIHFIGSLRTVQVNDLAGFSLFGRPWYIPKNGLYLVPLWFVRFIRADRNYHDKRFPGPADRIFRISREQQEKREGGDIPPPGFFRPILVMTGEPRLTSADKKLLEVDINRNPLDQQLSVEVAYSLRFRADQGHGGIYRIARNLSAKTGDIDARIEDLMREQSGRDMRAVLSRLTPATIIENWDLVNEVFVKRIQLAAIRLGIDIDSRGGGLEDLNASHTTNEDQAEVARAEFRKRAAVIAAEGKKVTLTKEGEGKGAGLLAELTADAKGRERVKRALGVNGEAVLAAETAGKILEKTDVILAGGDGMKDLLSLVKGAQSMLGLGAAKAKKTEKDKIPPGNNREKGE